MKNMQRIILAFLLLFAIISILMVTRQMKSASSVEEAASKVTFVAPIPQHRAGPSGRASAQSFDSGMGRPT